MAISHRSPLSYHAYRRTYDIIYRHDDEVSKGLGNWEYFIAKKITFSRVPTGVIRIQFKVRQAANDAGYKAYIARNNATILGTERLGQETEFVSYTEDIGGWVGGDELRMYLGSQGTVEGIFLRALRILGSTCFDSELVVSGVNS